MNLYVVQSTVSDNYFCILSAEDGSDGLIIDPIDARAALAVIDENQITPRLLLNTHGHPDHIGGNPLIKNTCRVPLAAHDGDQGWIGAIDRILEPGDTIQVGDTSLEVVHTPGHTPGHISLYTPGHLFSGDTIFVAGCGHCKFGGDPTTLYQTYANILPRFPDETRIYPGHNYAVRNLEFALSLDPDCQPAKAKLDSVRGSSGHCITTLGEERSYNPFFRVGQADFAQALAKTHPEIPNDPMAQFLAIRKLRDTW
ncbi:MAG: MBL fold metallo-hydrolase [Myxococcales bacterium]|nr:MBL fold metallo-hydrolase [Myxococcales bacterium]